MQTTCVFVFAIYLAYVYGQEESLLPPSSPETVNEPQHSLKRAARQSMPEPPDSDAMTTPPNIPEFEHQFINRKRREAKGIGGSMPTRKG